jgi:S1-C subfamily serine protease
MPSFPYLPDIPQMPDEFYRRGEGSGFVWDDEGHIVTNHHVVSGASVVEVHFFDETVVEAEIIGLDSQSDIAVLRVAPDATELHPVALGDSDTLRVGQMAIAIGNPLGQTWTMTSGIFSALGRTIRSGSNPFAIPEVIQTDAAINPGNSGGPLLDIEGRVVGVNTMIMSQTGFSSGVGFAIPINIVTQVVPDLISSGDYSHPWLGIEGRDLLDEDVESQDLPVRHGALVISVVQDGPADDAGLHGSDRTVVVDGVELKTGGDVIVGVDGEPVGGMNDLITYLVLHTRPGEDVTLQVIRNGEEVAVNVTLGERPENGVN